MAVLDDFHQAIQEDVNSIHEEISNKLNFRENLKWWFYGKPGTAIAGMLFAVLLGGIGDIGVTVERSFGMNLFQFINLPILLMIILTLFIWSLGWIKNKGRPGSKFLFFDTLHEVIRKLREKKEKYSTAE